MLQEALTNVLRHAVGRDHLRASSRRAPRASRSSSSTARVRRLVPGRDSGGRGLRGIAERVGAVGGTLEHGPDGSGGYRLRAMFPRTRP